MTNSVEIVKLADPDTVAADAARRFVNIAAASVESHGSFSVALSGGSTPKRMYKLLASDEWRGKVPWENTHIFFGDERRVSHGDPQSNYFMAREALLDHVPVPADQIYPMDGIGLIRATVRDYEAKLYRYFKHGKREFPRFDLVLLGMGSDGHTASIFPGTRAVSDRSATVIVYEVPQLGVERITLTFSVINNARNILFLVTGESKADALASVMSENVHPSQFPAEAVVPVDGTVVWLVDEAAASKL